MASINPTTMSLSQKKRMWQQQQYFTFEQISKDKNQMFRYFLANNDLFHLIKPIDVFKFYVIEESTESKSSTIFLQTILSTVGVLTAGYFGYLSLGRGELKSFLKRRGRMISLSALLLVPALWTGISKQYFMDEHQIAMYQLQEKYSFGFQDFMNANRLFERALAVNKLEELLEKRAEFDWTGIPELPEPKDAKPQK